MKILAIGNALVDVLIEIPDDTLIKAFSLQKGSVTWIDAATSDSILKKAANLRMKEVAGGSSSNTIRAYSIMGGEGFFLAKLGKDNHAEVFKENLSSAGVNLYIQYGKGATGTAITLISPDGERTFATHLGSAGEFVLEDITDEMLCGVDCLYVEGYLFSNEEFLFKAVAEAKRRGIKICLDISSPFIASHYRTSLEKLVDEYVDVLFANEEEILTYTQTGSVAEAIDRLHGRCNTVIIKMGAEGSLIIDHEQRIHVEAVPAACVKDTTGAGDVFAAGLFYGMSHNLPLKTCGNIGSTLASEVISGIGAELSPLMWERINKKLRLFTEK